MEWLPKTHTIVRDDNLRNTLHETGYATFGNIGVEKLQALKDLYRQLHNFKYNEGGMFYSLYSDDINYRKKVHAQIGEILSPVYDSIFTNYKSVINSFIVKVPGPKSEFTLHQDSSGLDELKYSALSLWIPLQDTSLANGCLCVVPQSHKMFYPYRGISITPPFQNIQNELRRYLLPLELNAGDVFMFDNRLVHYSPANETENDRVVVMSGLFPDEAAIEVCYRDESIAGSPVEVYEQPEDYLLINTKFFHDCTCRPEMGVKKREIQTTFEDWNFQKFQQQVQQFNLKPTDIPGLIKNEISMHIISEPV